MYYACAMTASVGRHVPKKAIVIIYGAVALLIIMAAAAYWFIYRPSALQQGAQQLSTYKDASTLAQKDGIIADGDLKTAYIAYVKANKTADAKALFTRAVAAKSDTASKSDLLLQEVSLALQYSQVDEAEAAALQAVRLRPTEDTYGSAIRVYLVKNDPVQQRVYLVKARDSISTSDPAKKAALVKMYNERIAQIDGMSRAK